MPELLSWQSTDPQRVKERAAACLAAGNVVVLPSEIGYEMAVSSACPSALERLRQLARESAEDVELCVALPHAAGLQAWVRDPYSVALRLARRLWPGPLLLRIGPQGNPDWRDLGLAQSQLTFRCPDHDAPLLLLQSAIEPLIMARAPSGMTAAQLLKEFGEALELFVEDDVPVPGGAAPTVVQVQDRSWSIVRPGMFSEADIRACADVRVLFVCTGNTCRSPLAQALCAKLLAERLGCAPQELRQRGFQVQSAGLAAYRGDEASPEAVAVAQEFGADLSAHRSQPLTLDLFLGADFLFTMTHGHLSALLGYNIGMGPQLRLLSPHGTDVVDPIGRDTQVYRDCAQEITQHLEALLPELQSAL
jgi:L-threonylcarbamoyladenylate synthase